MSELYTIDRTPQTDLEKFQSLRIEALLKDNARLKSKVQQAEHILIEILNDAESIEVIEPIIFEKLQ